MLTSMSCCSASLSPSAAAAAAAVGGSKAAVGGRRREQLLQLEARVSELDCSNEVLPNVRSASPAAHSVIKF